MSFKTDVIQDSDFQVSKATEVIKKFTPLINKEAYKFYSRYNSILDFNDAKQEITICMYKCLLRYDPEKSHFITYFRTAVNRLMSRFYYSYLHSIQINQNTVDTNELNESNERVDSLDRVINQKEIDTTVEVNPGLLRVMLSEGSQKLYDLFMVENKINPWLISKRFKLSRYFAQQMFENFKQEVAEVTGR